MKTNFITNATLEYGRVHIISLLSLFFGLDDQSLNLFMYYYRYTLVF